MEENPKTLKKKKRICLSVGSLWVWQHQEKPDLQVLPLGQSLYAVVPLRNHTSMFVFHVYAPTSKKEEICQAYLRVDFEIYLQKNSYFSFYDKNGQYWLFYLTKHTEESFRDLLHAVTMARCQNPFEDFETISQNLSIVNGDEKEISNGDLVTIRCTIWAVSRTEHPWVKGALVVAKRSLEMEVGNGNEVLGIERSLAGMVKGQKRLLLIPGRLVKAKWLVEYNFPLENPIIAEIEITNFRFASEKKKFVQPRLEIGCKDPVEATSFTQSRANNFNAKALQSIVSPKIREPMEAFTQQHQQKVQIASSPEEDRMLEKKFTHPSSAQTEPALGSVDHDIRIGNGAQSSSISTHQPTCIKSSDETSSIVWENQRVNPYCLQNEYGQHSQDRRIPYSQKGYRQGQPLLPANKDYIYLFQELDKINQKLDWMHSARAVDKSEIQKLNDWVTTILNCNRDTGSQLNYLRQAYESLMRQLNGEKKEMQLGLGVKPSYILEKMTSNSLEMNKNLGIVLQKWQDEYRSEESRNVESEKTLELSEKLSKSESKQSDLGLQVRSLEADLRNKDLIISEKSEELNRLLAELNDSDNRVQELVYMLSDCQGCPDLVVRNRVTETSIPSIDIEIQRTRDSGINTGIDDPPIGEDELMRKKINSEYEEESSSLVPRMCEIEEIAVQKSKDVLKKEENNNPQEQLQHSQSKSHDQASNIETSPNSSDLQLSPPAAVDANPKNEIVVLMTETSKQKMKDKKEDESPEKTNLRELT